jgi:lysosomal acid lipase/cholesteryl ester hydrolase
MLNIRTALAVSSLFLVGFVQSGFLDITDITVTAKEIDNDANKNTKEIAIENGFAFEEYTVVTEDGYILGLHRIPGKLGEAQKKKPVVLLQHGLEGDSTQWVINSADKAPAFNLVN